DGAQPEVGGQPQGVADVVLVADLDADRNLLLDSPQEQFFRRLTSRRLAVAVALGRVELATDLFVLGVTRQAVGGGCGRGRCLHRWGGQAETGEEVRERVGRLSRGRVRRGERRL